MSSSGAILSGRWQSLIKVSVYSALKQRNLDPDFPVCLCSVYACVCTIKCLCALMIGCACVHAGSASEGETDDIEWKRVIFHIVSFTLRRGLPMVLDLCGDVCMWSYQAFNKVSKQQVSPLKQESTLMHKKPNSKRRGDELNEGNTWKMSCFILLFTSLLHTLVCEVYLNRKKHILHVTKNDMQPFPDLKYKRVDQQLSDTKIAHCKFQEDYHY